MPRLGRVWGSTSSAAQVNTSESVQLSDLDGEPVRGLGLTSPVPWSWLSKVGVVSGFQRVLGGHDRGLSGGVSGLGGLHRDRGFLAIRQSRHGEGVPPVSDAVAVFGGPTRHHGEREPVGHGLVVVLDLGRHHTRIRAPSHLHEVHLPRPRVCAAASWVALPGR